MVNFSFNKLEKIEIITGYCYFLMAIPLIGTRPSNSRIIVPLNPFGNGTFI